MTRNKERIVLRLLGQSNNNDVTTNDCMLRRHSNRRNQAADDVTKSGGQLYAVRGHLVLEPKKEKSILEKESKKRQNRPNCCRRRYVFAHNRPKTVLDAKPIKPCVEHKWTNNDALLRDGLRHENQERKFKLPVIKTTVKNEPNGPASPDPSRIYKFSRIPRHPTDDVSKQHPNFNQTTKTPFKSVNLKEKLNKKR